MHSSGLGAAYREEEVVVMREFDSSRQLVFDAYTKSDILRRWLVGPPGWELVVCDVDLKVGGGYRWSWRSSDGTTMGMRGLYRDIVPNERLVATERFDDPWAPCEALITIQLAEHDGKTTVSTTMRFESSAAEASALRSEMEDGMTASYDRLAHVLPSLVH